MSREERRVQYIKLVMGAIIIYLGIIAFAVVVDKLTRIEFLLQGIYANI